MTHQEAVDRANRVYNRSIQDGRGVSEAFGEAFLAIQTETAEKCAGLNERLGYKVTAARIRAAFKVEAK